MVITLFPASAFAAATDDHELTKMAEWVDEEAGLAKITLKTKGTPITTTTGADVVMVLDASGSMDDYVTVQTEAWVNYKVVAQHIHYVILSNYLTVVLYTASGHESDRFDVETDYYGTLTRGGQNKLNRMLYETMYEESATRWSIATDAVEALTDEVIPNKNTKNRLGLVVFSSSGYAQNSNECGLTNDSSKIAAKIPKSPKGGTNYTTALQRAYNMLNARTDKSRPGYVVFLTDGEPGLQGESGNNPSWNGVNEIASLKSKDITIYTVGFNLTNGDATNRLENYATSSAHYHNITDASELSGLLSDIGSTITANVSIHDIIDTEHFTLTNKPETSVSYVASAGTVEINAGKEFVWSLPNFSTAEQSLEIFVQLKKADLEKGGEYPTNVKKSAYGTYKNQSGNVVNLAVTENDYSSAVPKLKVAKSIAAKFNFVGLNKDKASFVDPAQADQLVKIGDKVTEPEVAVAPGYQVIGWYKEANCTGSKFDFDAPVDGNNTITLHARVDEDRSKTYAYQVVFYKNGVQTGDPVPATVWQGAPTVTLASVKGLKTGDYTKYTFQEAKVGLDSYNQDANIIGIQPNGSTVIKVYYTSNPVNLVFDRGEHGKFSAYPTESSVTTATSYDAIFDAAPGITTDPGWATVGWYDTVEKKFVTFPQTVTGAKTYEMKYQKQDDMWFKVTFLAGDHGTLNTNQNKVEWPSVLKDTTLASLGGIPTVTAENNYEFIGWSTDNGATLIQNEDLPTTITQNATYTAQWTQIYNVSYYVYEKKSSADTTITAKFDSEAEAEAAVAAHITHTSTRYSPALLSDQSKISNVDLNKFAVSTTPDAKDRTETADAKFADLIRNYKGTSDLNAAYNNAPGYDIVPFRLVKEGNIIHVDCYLVKNAEAWTTITFKAGTHGQWEGGTNADVVIDAIKGAAWSDYSGQVPTPIAASTGWKLAAPSWDKTLPSENDLIPNDGLTFTAQWTEDNAVVSFQVKGIMVDGTEEFFGVVKPDSQSIQKGTTAADPTAAAIENIQPGYKFDGWYTDEECEHPFEFSTVIMDTTLLYGEVVIKDEDWARVTFTTDGHGTLNGNTDDVVTDPILIGNAIGRAIPSAKANAGYEFEAWYRVMEGESGIEEILETPAEDTEVLGNMTYLAKFSSLLNVSFIINKSKAAGGTISPVTISGVHMNTPWTDISVPTVVGKLRQNIYSHDYEFAGWNASFPDTVTSNLIFTAKFVDVYSFVVEHADINDDASPEDVYPNEDVIAPVKRKASEEISSQANDPIRGYELTNITVFIGKNKLIVDTTAELIQELKEKYNITLTEDGTLSGAMPDNCIWIKYGYEKLEEHTVEYVSDGQVTNMPNDIIDRYKGDEIVVSNVTPQRDGFTFGGWVVKDDVVTITNGRFIMPDSDVELRAVWEPNEDVWNFTVEHYLEGSEIPFETVAGSVLKREPNIESVALYAPQGYKFKEYQINGDPTVLPIRIDEDGRTVNVVYEKNDLIVKHVYGDNTVYDTTQSQESVEGQSVIVNAVNSGRYTKLKSVTVNGVAVSSSRSITLDFSEIDKYEVVFVYGKKSSDSGDSGNSSDNGSDFGEEVTILDEEVPLADGLNMIDHFAYIFGYTDGTVKPTNKISREEVAAIFYRLLSDDTRATMRSTTQDFPDVSSQRWSNTSIATLANGSVISGYPGGEFKPDNAITRAEFAVIVSKFDNLSTTDTNQFSDIDNHWAKDFINSAALKGWINGYPDGTFRPNEYITRAEAVTLINSVLNRKVSKEGLLENARYWSDNNKDAWYYEAVMEATNSHDYTRETPDGAETWTAITPDKTWN